MSDVDPHPGLVEDEQVLQALLEVPVLVLKPLIIYEAYPRLVTGVTPLIIF